MGCNFFESISFMMQQAAHMPLRAIMLAAVCLVVLGVTWLVFRRHPPHRPDAS